MATYVFLDESGDLSFDFSKTGVSEHFIITALMTTDPRPIELAVKKTLRWVKHRHRKHRGCLHAYHEDPPTRMKLLGHLALLDCQVAVICLNKRKVYTRLHDEKAVLYNYVANILIDRLMKGGHLKSGETVSLVAAKRETNVFLNLNFQNYLRTQVHQKHGAKIDVSILSPHEHKALQAADMMSWSFFRHLQSLDDQYFSIIKHLVHESSLF